MSKSFRNANIPALAMLGLVLVGTVAIAANNSTFSLKINPGTLDIKIVDSTNSFADVTTPTVTIGSASGIDTTMTGLVGAAAPTGTLGTDTQAILIANQDFTRTGWTASLGTAQATWLSGTDTLVYSGAAEADGQLKVAFPSKAVGLTNGNSTASMTNISLGSDVSSFPSAGSITIASATSSAPSVGDWVIKQIGLTQTIPAGTVAGTYTLPMTLSVVSN